jgi:hypothetical protein
MNISKNVNGNKVLKIAKHELYGKNGFSIQTLGNLPNTHKNGIFYGTKAEVFNYVENHGTKRQKDALLTNQRFTLRELCNGQKRDKAYNTYDFWRELSEQDIDKITDLVGGHKKSKNRVKSCLTYNLNMFPNWWLERIECINNRWHYTAGQDYIFEMASIRKHCK